MSLSNQNKKHFRVIGHNLKPIVTVAGKGLSENVLAELERALDDHELIKIKVAIEDRELRKATIEQARSKLNAENVQEIGKIALFYRESSQDKPKNSNIR